MMLEAGSFRVLVNGPKGKTRHTPAQSVQSDCDAGLACGAADRQH
jgi:hypothetical protein